MPLFDADASAVVKLVRDASSPANSCRQRFRARSDALRLSTRTSRSNSALLAAAGALAEPALRALDAIHVAAAAALSPFDALVSYDERQAAAARLAGIRTVAPGG